MLEIKFRALFPIIQILSSIERREVYDKTGLTEDQFGDVQGYERFFREQQRFQFQYVRWTPPGRRQPHDLINFVNIILVQFNFKNSFDIADLSIR